MCQIMEDMRNEALEEGIQKGIQRGIQKGIKEAAVNTAKRMLKDGKYGLEEIANIANLSLDEIIKLKEE